MNVNDSVEADLSPKAITVRLQRMSQLRALCLSLAEAGRRAGLHDRPVDLHADTRRSSEPYEGAAHIGPAPS